jgi:hypothetical protein
MECDVKKEKNHDIIKRHDESLKPSLGFKPVTYKSADF